MNNYQSVHEIIVDDQEEFYNAFGLKDTIDGVPKDTI